MFVSRFLPRPVVISRLRLHIPCRPLARFIASTPVGKNSEHVSPHRALELLRKSKALTLAEIRKLHPSLLAAMEAAAQEDNPSLHFRKEDVKLIMASLASSGQSRDMQDIDNIMQNILPQFKIEASFDIYAAILRSLVQKGSIDVTQKWLARMASDHYPDSDQYHYALSNLPFPTTEAMLEFVRLVRTESWYPTTEETVSTVCKSYWDIYARQDRIPSEEEFTALLDRLKYWNCAWKQETQAMIYALYAEAGRVDLAKRVSHVYKSRSKHLFLSQEVDAELERLKKLKEEGLSKVLESLPTDDWGKHGPQFQYRLGAMLVEDFRSVDDLRRIDRAIPFGVTHRWKTVIHELLQQHKLEEALEVYQESRKADVPMDGALVGGLIMYMAFRSPEAGSDRLLRISLAIYRDFADYADAHPNPISSRHSSKPDLTIYRHLMRWLARHPTPRDHLAMIQRLIHDMPKYGVEPVPSLAASVISIGMETASSPEVALEAYREGRHLLQANSDAYAAVLQAFCTRCFKSEEFFTHAAKDYFTIVKDMQRANATPTSRVYTILLSTIGLTASRLRRDGRLTMDQLENLISTTRRVHDQLTLDPTLEPSPIVFSQLINTYQRLGCLGDAYRVWELMYLTGTLTDRSVSNILDGCGYAGDLFTARAIWNKLGKDGFPLDQKHWEAYIECLGRVGEVVEAAKVLGQMPSQYDKTFAAKLVRNFSRKFGKFVPIAGYESTQAPCNSRTSNENKSQ